MVISDVVEAILVRLPAHDLLRCKSVYKSWYSLISSPPFITTHAKFICNKEEGRKIAKILSHKDWPESGSYYETPDEWKDYTLLKIEGSSNGLVLYSEHGPRLCVTNPVTREFREVTQPPRIIPKEWRCYGFGYDSSTDDYKVVMAISHPGETLVHVLSLKSNVWNISSAAGQVNYSIHDGWLQKPGILLYGALHWFWFDANKNPLIVSFDIAKEEFKEIPQPHDTRYVWNIGCTLGIMNGRLCIYPYYDNSKDFPSCGTWVMKNYHHLNPSWELLSKDSEMNNHAVHHLLNNYTPRSKIMPAYSCDENIQLSRSKEYIPSPIFVKTLVSPFVNNNDNGGGPSHAKDNKSTANAAGSVKEKERDEGSL